jgi:putative ABC transport system permease protein
MRLLSSVRTFLSYMFHRHHIEGEMDEEFRSHLKNRAADLERQGLSRAEAERQARIEFGGYEKYKEECRETLGTRLLQEFVADIRYGLRQLRRSPVLTGQFCATIAIGMGAATALVSLMLALGYQPLPYRDPGRLVAIWERVEAGESVAAISGPDLRDFADTTHTIYAVLGGFAVPQVWLVDRRGVAQVRACYIEASVFSNLGIRPVLGRGVRPDDEPLVGNSAAAPAWISYRLWQTRYGSSPSVIGATIGIASSAAGLDKLPVRIAGVLPHGVSIPLPFMENRADVWYLLSPAIVARSRESSVFFGLGRLRPGVSVVQAQAALTVGAERLGQRYSFDKRKRPVVESLEAIAQAPARQTVGVLALGVSLVFLVGCVNLAMLMGAEGRRRRREIAIRAALGAGRRRLWYEVASEKCLLTLLSLALGVAFASGLLRLLARLVPAAGLGPALPHPPPLNLAVLVGFAAFSLAAALAWSALLVAAADGPGSSRTLASAGGGLGYTGLSDSGPRASRWRLIMLAAQAGIGTCLLAAAALTARTYTMLSAANLGPEPRRTVLLSVSPRDNMALLTDAQATDFNQQVLSRLSRLPGTRAIAEAELFPPPGFPMSFVKRGDAPGTTREANSPVSVSPGYFRTLGISILFGRGFNETDNSGGERVAIISLDMAESNWGAPQQAVGSEIAFGSKHRNHYKIIGVAANFTGYWSQMPIPTVYLPQAQSGNWCAEVILRTAASPRAVATLAPEVLAGMAIPATIADVSTMQARWQATLTRPLARMAGMLLLALLGLGLSVQGVYAVAAGTVAARRHELAVRSALGAPAGRLVWNVTRELVFAVVVGAGLGVAAVLELRPLLEHWLGQVAVWQVGPIAAAVVMLALAAGAGCYFPARTAARANPVEVLRQG